MPESASTIASRLPGVGTAQQPLGGDEARGRPGSGAPARWVLRRPGRPPPPVRRCSRRSTDPSLEEAGDAREGAARPDELAEHAHTAGGLLPQLRPRSLLLVGRGVPERWNWSARNASASAATPSPRTRSQGLCRCSRSSAPRPAAQVAAHPAPRRPRAVQPMGGLSGTAPTGRSGGRARRRPASRRRARRGRRPARESGGVEARSRSASVSALIGSALDDDVEPVRQPEPGAERARHERDRDVGAVGDGARGGAVRDDRADREAERGEARDAEHEGQRQAGHGVGAGRDVEGDPAEHDRGDGDEERGGEHAGEMAGQVASPGVRGVARMRLRTPSERRIAMVAARLP